MADKERKKQTSTVIAPPVAPDGNIHTLHTCIDTNDAATFTQLLGNGADVNFSRKGAHFRRFHSNPTFHSLNTYMHQHFNPYANVWI